VDTLPHDQVLEHLEDISENLAMRYLEYLINEKGNRLPDFHTRLAELYLDRALEEYAATQSETSEDDGGEYDVISIVTMLIINKCSQHRCYTVTRSTQTVIRFS
jgi:hypothetical protein